MQEVSQLFASSVTNVEEFPNLTIGYLVFLANMDNVGYNMFFSTCIVTVGHTKLIATDLPPPSTSHRVVR